MSLWGDERHEPHEHATSFERQECIARGLHYRSLFEVFSPDRPVSSLEELCEHRLIWGECPFCGKHAKEGLAESA